MIIKLGVKSFCLLNIILIAFSASGQNPSQLGNDTIKLQIRTSPDLQMVFAYYYSKNKSKTDTFRVERNGNGNWKDSARFYRIVKGYFGGDSIAKRVVDSVKKHQAAEDFQVNIAEDSIQVIENRNEPQALEIPENTTKETDVLPKNSSIWLELTLGILLVVVVILVILLIKKRRNKSASEEEILMRLSQAFPELKKHRNNNSKAVEAIISTFHDMKGELEDVNEHSRILKKDLEEKQLLLHEKQNEVAQLHNELNDARQTITENIQNNQAFKNYSALLLDKYYNELNIALQKNEYKDQSETSALVLKNIIPFAFHGASLLKSLTENATALDELNIKLLQGQAPNTNDVITEDTPKGHCDPLAYSIYHLLKEHGISRLDEVFIKGYKIGE